MVGIKSTKKAKKSFLHQKRVRKNIACQLSLCPGIPLLRGCLGFNEYKTQLEYIDVVMRKHINYVFDKKMQIETNDGCRDLEIRPIIQTVPMSGQFKISFKKLDT